MVVRIDEARWPANQVPEAPVLGLELGRDLRPANPAGANTTQETSQGPKTPLLVYQAGNLFGRQDGSVERQARVPTEFDWPARLLPGADRVGRKR
jgi:hypothetical protein